MLGNGSWDVSAADLLSVVNPEQISEDVFKVVADVSKTLDPPKSSLKRRTLRRLFPPWKGGLVLISIQP